MQPPLRLILDKLETHSAPSPIQERAGVVYTKPWIVELILDLAGYHADSDLVSSLAIEPAAGEGAFLVPMALRLLESCRRIGRNPLNCENSLLAYELEEESAKAARSAVIDALTSTGVSRADATALARMWIRVGDYLLEAGTLPPADFVIGNPPYIRLEDIPAESAAMYRAVFSTMIGRADIYVAFFEAALTQLSPNGVCAFICADRWMLNQYGSELRSLITSRYRVETIIEMHNADAFLSDVSAYPAVTVIRKAEQGPIVVANIDRSAEKANGRLAKALRAVAAGFSPKLPKGVTAERISTWFKGKEPWPCASPKRLSILKELEARFPLLESEETATKVGIGVATGADDVFITKNSNLVEKSRLLPLAMASDIASGTLKWSGHYLVNPWDENGVVDIEEYPRLKAYFETHRAALKERHIARKRSDAWVRTIDRVNIPLTKKAKLYIADIKERLNPVLDNGDTYPHHNLYFVQSDTWDLEALGGLLLSDVGQFFVECYGVRMRGGYLRFQAQYLRRIRVPRPQDISEKQQRGLIKAFRERDREAATRIALDIYEIDSFSLGDQSGH